MKCTKERKKHNIKLRKKQMRKKELKQALRNRTFMLFDNITTEHLMTSSIKDIFSKGRHYNLKNNYI